MHRVLAVLASGLLSTPAYGQVREIGQVPGPFGQLVTSAPIVISEPGSYRLVSNIVATGSDAAIDIRAFNVTLDLNGFLVDARGGGAAIVGSGPTGGSGISVINGDVQSLGDGIRLEAGNCRVEKVFIGNVGRQGLGISTGGNCTIRNSILRGSNVAIACIFCIVEGNTVSAVGEAGISATNGSRPQQPGVRRCRIWT